MLNNFSKKDITGMIAGIIGVAAGLGIGVYTYLKCEKECKEMDKIMETINDSTEELNDLLKQTGLMNKEEA
jgi:hypothetical protein